MANLPCPAANFGAVRIALVSLGLLFRLGLLRGPAPVLRVGNLLARFGAQNALFSGLGFGRRFLGLAFGLCGYTVERGQQSACPLQPGYLDVNSGKNVFNRHELRIMQLVRRGKPWGGYFLLTNKKEQS